MAVSKLDFSTVSKLVKKKHLYFVTTFSIIFQKSEKKAKKWGEVQKNCLF